MFIIDFIKWLFGKKRIEYTPQYNDTDIQITKVPSKNPSKPLKYSECPQCHSRFPGAGITIIKCNNCGYRKAA